MMGAVKVVPHFAVATNMPFRRSIFDLGAVPFNTGAVDGLLVEQMVDGITAQPQSRFLQRGLGPRVDQTGSDPSKGCD